MTSASALPKVELHLHLDCSLSFNAVSKLVPGVTREEYASDYIAPARCTNLAEFLTRAPKGILLMQDEASLRLTVEDVFHQLQADNVIYAELRLAPLLHLERGLSAGRVVDIVNRATEDMSRATGIDARLILCTLRHFTRDQSIETAHLVKYFQGSRVVALDIAGDEAGFPLTAHIEAYDFARENNLFRTAHAGEACGPDSVWETLRLLQPTRIGHGVRRIEDPELVRYLTQHRIHLEICPLSNVQIVPEIPDMVHHPIDRLYRVQVPLNINTDTRMLTATTLSQNYEEVSRVFGWGAPDFRETNLMAVDAAFIDETVKSALRAKINAESYIS